MSQHNLLHQIDGEKKSDEEEKLKATLPMLKKNHHLYNKQSEKSNHANTALRQHL